ncbi:hypothetical protein J2Y48_003986 [Mycoplana sp. BE70]|nr:hypothetical protein [Mycoplana sp. BE70]MDR6758678.1 hypothetical protein [Mycoplana sp. BE70]
MPTDQETLDLIDRHIAEAEQHIVDQERLVTLLELHHNRRG